MCDTKQMKRITQFKNNEFEGQGTFQMGECVPVFFVEVLYFYSV